MPYMPPTWATETMGFVDDLPTPRLANDRLLGAYAEKRSFASFAL